MNKNVFKGIKTSYSSIALCISNMTILQPDVRIVLLYSLLLNVIGVRGQCDEYGIQVDGNCYYVMGPVQQVRSKNKLKTH